MFQPFDARGRLADRRRRARRIHDELGRGRIHARRCPRQRRELSERDCADRVVERALSFYETPVTLALDASLSPGRYWIRLNANGSYIGAVYTALSGLASFSRSNLGNDFLNQPPIALCVREARRFDAFCSGDGSGTACPCGNAGATERGCANSFPTFGALLSANGLASVAADTVVLTASGVPATTSVLFFQGTAQQNGGLGTVFGDGLRCASGSVIRPARRPRAAVLASYPTGGDSVVSVRGLIPPAGGMRFYQAWYRNAARSARLHVQLDERTATAWGP